MAEVDEQKKDIEDLGGGVQIVSSRFLQKENEANIGENVSYNLPGGFGKKLGYSQKGNTVTSTTSTSTSTSTTTTSTSTSTTTSTSTSTTTTV